MLELISTAIVFAIPNFIGIDILGTKIPTMPTPK
jgi:hypothetical protein